MLCAFALAVILAGQTPAQPDFSGRWVLVAPDAAPADVPAVLVVAQHLRRTDIRGNSMTPFWEFLIVEGDDSKSGVRPGIYRIGVGGGMVGGIAPRDASGQLPPRRMTQESVSWRGDTLAITSEAWMEREDGTRESYEQHTETWALTGQGRLVIAFSDSGATSRKHTVTYQKEQSAR